MGAGEGKEKAFLLEFRWGMNLRDGRATFYNDSYEQAGILVLKRTITLYMLILESS